MVVGGALIFCCNKKFQCIVQFQCAISALPAEASLCHVQLLSFVAIFGSGLEKDSRKSETSAI